VPRCPLYRRYRGESGSDSDIIIKLARLTLSRHSEAGGFMPLLKTGEIHRRLGQETCHARMQNQLLVFGIGFFGSELAMVLSKDRAGSL
jgi:hypothetical protein